MKKYIIKMPIVCQATLKTEANSEKEAMEKAMNYSYESYIQLQPNHLDIFYVGLCDDSSYIYQPSIEEIN